VNNFISSIDLKRDPNPRSSLRSNQIKSILYRSRSRDRDNILFDEYVIVERHADKRRESFPANPKAVSMPKRRADKNKPERPIMRTTTRAARAPITT